jgi:geranylgeranyl reductase family protein
LRRSYDVVVVGAGPAGATLAHELASRGADILVLEKETLPRYKACAGGITVRASQLLGLDMASIARNVVRGARVLYRGREFTKWYHQPLIYTVMRDEFDCLLMERARNAGAILMDNSPVSDLTEEVDCVRISTSEDCYSAQIAVGADGARSVVAARTGLMRRVLFGLALEAEISVPTEKLIQWDSLMGLSLGYLRGGYGWVFPKKDHLSVGIGGSLNQARRLKSRYMAVLASLGLEKDSVTRLRSQWLPVRRKRQLLCSRRCALLGDAAGLVDPLTGEGIHHAVKSAKIAAPLVLQCLQKGGGDLQEYSRALEREISPELVAARAFRRLFAWFPGLCYESVQDSDRLWKACCRLLRGEETYLTLKRRLGPGEALVDLFSL